jgi:hypothetical protein
MKKILLSLSLILCFSTIQVSALSLIHYWNFNGTNVPYLTEASSMDVVLTPLTPIQTDSSMTTTHATLIYQAKAGTVTFKSYWDTNSPGSTLNARNGDLEGSALRPRDGWSSMELVLNIPSTGFRNLKIMYDAQRSGSGPNVNTYTYSVDGGTTWKSDGLSTNGGALGTNATTTIPAEPGFATSSVTITDPAAENNPSLKFRIWYSDPTNTKGNNRIDNITVEGDILAGVNSTVAEKVAMYPNPCKSGVVNFANPVEVEVYSILGKQIKSIANTTTLSTTDLAKGIYTVRINGTSTQKLIIE